MNISVTPDEFARLSGSLSALEKSFVVTREDISALKSATQSMQDDIGKLGAAFESKSKSNMPIVGAMFAAIITLLLGVAGGTISLVRGDIDHVTTPIAARQEAFSARLAGQERELGEFEHRVVDELTNLHETDARYVSSFATIDAELRAALEIANTRWTQQTSVNALMWERIYPGSRYPTETYAPTTFGTILPTTRTRP